MLGHESRQLIARVDRLAVDRDDRIAADDDLLPLDHELLGVEESFARALAEPDETVPPAERDPLGPMPGDPDWAGGQGGGLASTMAGAQAVITGTLAKVLDNR